MSSLDVTSRKLLSLEFALPFDLRIQLRRGWPIWGDGRLRFHLQNFRLRWWRRHLSWSDRVPMNETLDAPQIARLRLGGVRRTDFPCSPCARETCQERREIRFVGARGRRLATVRKQNQVALHRAHFLEQLQRIERTTHLAQLHLVAVRHRLG